MLLKTIRGVWLVAFTALSITVSTPVLASNDAMMELLKVLHKNGTIGDEAYNLLKNSAKGDAERTEAKIEETTEQKLASVNTMSDKLKWAEKIKLKGDFRLRRHYEKSEPDNGDNESRERYRYRLRLGAEAQVHDSVTVGLGFASGSDDARSTNETLDDGFSTKDARLDYAYAEWKPTAWASVVGGKFKRKNYLWATTDLIWDGDINPEGLSVNLQSDNSVGTAYANAGYWLLEEYNDISDDPTLGYVQVGHKFSSGKLFANVAGTYYAFDGLEDAAVVGRRRGSNTLRTGDYAFDYDSIGLSAEIGVNNFILPGKQFALFSDYIKNDDSDEDTGRSIGFKFGDSKVKDQHSWQIKYINADLEADAFPDFLPDSDRFGGNTGVKSNEFIFKYAVAKNIILALDYYASEQDVPGLDDDEDKVFQSDILFKF